MRSVKRIFMDSLPNICAAGCFLLVLTVTAAMTGQWCWQANGYNSYALQADAWLKGQLDLGQDYPWLELAIYEGRYYVSFPPFPSFLLLPFAALFGTQTPDGIISLCFSLLGVWMCVNLARKAGQSPLQAVLLTLCLYLGSGYLFIALTPAVWFFAQTLCFNLCVMALYFAMTARGGWSLGCWACAVGCRPMVILYLPVFLIILWRAYRENNRRDSLLSAVRKRWYWILGPAVIGAGYMILNYLRFGSALEFGHNYLPEFQRISTGQFSLTYFPENFRLLFRLPAWDADTGRIIFQPFDTYLFALINPLSAVAIIVCLWRCLRTDGRQNRGLVILIFVLSLAYVFILCCHRTLGGWQFGNRYLKDLMPFVFCALCLCAPETRRFRVLTGTVLAFSAALHLAGTVITYNYWW